MTTGSTTIKFVLAFLIIFLASTILIYLFESLEKIIKGCEKGEFSDTICSKFSGFTIDLICIVSIIGFLVFIISATFFLLIR